ncbi:MAG TPA: sugar phosphate nucleotidyltransferase [Chitinophagaceae bacterium]|nr:sugar phosphate nucleotidyltransferase [Chitinophagaceae bacterium]
MKPAELMILAGGSGTRIRNLIPGLPKILAPVGNRPFIDYLIRYYTLQGIDRFVFCLGELSELVMNHLEKHYPEIEKIYVSEDHSLGTGGAIKNGLAQCRDNTVLVINGDTYYAIQTEKAAAFHHMCGAECTMILKPMDEVSRYGNVELNGDYSIKAFSEKGKSGPGLINGGAYLLNRRLFLENEYPASFSFEKLYLEQGIGGRRIFGVKQDGFFIDIGTPEDYERAQTEIIAYDCRLA